MIEISFVEPDGTVHRVYARVGTTLMDVATRNAMPGILAICGGTCACATCHVVIAPEWRERIGPANDMEGFMLDTVDEQPGSRLSCQVKLTQACDGLIVQLPPPAD